MADFAHTKKSTDSKGSSGAGVDKKTQNDIKELQAQVKVLFETVENLQAKLDEFEVVDDGPEEELEEEPKQSKKGKSKKG